MASSLVPSCLFLSLFLLVPADGLYIASFNIQIFGPTKYGDKEVVNVLAQIVRRYDLVFIQEIRDIQETVIHQFLNDVNGGEDTFALVVSERLGTTNSKEQYAFMYRKSEVEVVEHLVHGDTDPSYHLFERPPFVAQINSLTVSGLPDFLLIGAHIRPSNVAAELNALVGVYEEMSDQFGINKALLLGDFNAGCSYLSKTAFNNLDLTTDDRFTWLIDEDTTVAVSTCHYDRFVSANGFEAHVINTSVAVFRFDDELGLDADTAKAVSDHYPIELRLQGALGSANAEENSGAARSVLLSIAVVLSVAMATTSLLI